MTSEKSNNHIDTLKSRIQQQTSAIQKLKAQQSKLSQYVQQFKSALKRKQEKQSLQATKKSSQQQQKLQKQLQKQVQNAKTMLKNYHHELRVLQKKSLKHTYTADDLLKIEDRLKQKQIELRYLQQQIKDLKIVKRKQEKLIEKKQKNQQNDGIKLAKLIEDVRKQKDLLQQLRKKSNKKEQQLQKKKLQVKQLQSKYFQKCKSNGQVPLSFQDFKQRRKQKKKNEQIQRQASQSLSKSKSHQPKKIITVKQMINNQYQSDHIQPTQKNLRELKMKKQVAQNSLKLAQKKDQKQIQELKERLDNLKNQNVILQYKLVDKLKEKQETIAGGGNTALMRNSGTSNEKSMNSTNFRQRNALTEGNKSLLKARMQQKTKEKLSRIGKNLVKQGGNLNKNGHNNQSSTVVKLQPINNK